MPPRSFNSKNMTDNCKIQIHVWFCVIKAWFRFSAVIYLMLIKFCYILMNTYYVLKSYKEYPDSVLY